MYYVQITCGNFSAMVHAINLQIGTVIDDDLIYTPTEGKFILYYFSRSNEQWRLKTHIFVAKLVAFDLFLPAFQEKLRKSLSRGIVRVILYLSELVW